MTPRTDCPDTQIRHLPQCGFGADIDFESLVKANQFLYRVYTPKEKSPFADNTDPFFVAPRFDEQFTRSPVDIPKVKFPETLIGSYAEIARHMEWTTRSSSTYISTSFSFSWSIWDAVKRYHQGVKKDVEIAIIDAAALGGRAATALQLMLKSSEAERNEQFWKWYRFAKDSQSVLIYGMVPRAAVLASIPLLQILRKMPSYFLRRDIQIINGNPLDQVAWNYKDRKISYRRFCQDMTSLFKAQPEEVRLRDSTAGAVRLALSFLRPFFHRVIQEDFDVAISHLRTLAIIISEWPGGLWVQERAEIQQVVETMVLALGEELREKYFRQEREEISRLQIVIAGLEDTISKLTTRFRYPMDDVEVDSDGDFELELEEADEPTLVSTEYVSMVKQRRPSLEMSVVVIPKIPVSFQTPITPPESPRNSLFIPTAIVPLTDLLTPQFSFKSDNSSGAGNQIVQDVDLVSCQASPASEQTASPPPTPPPSSPIKLPIFAEPSSASSHLYVVDGVKSVTNDLPQEQDQENLEDSGNKQLSVNENHAELVAENYSVDEPDFEPDEHEEISRNVVHDFSPVHSDYDPEETDIELDAEVILAPPSPSDSWVPIPRRISLLSTRSWRSSIASLDTLCEPIEFPTKRPHVGTAAAWSDSVEFVPSFPSELFHMHNRIPSSRTTSFSESMPSPGVIESVPSGEINVDPWTIPLPPSPTQSTVSLYLDSSHSHSLSRSSSSLSLSLSHSYSPVDKIEIEESIIQPMSRISLLSPITEKDDESDAQNLQSANIAETASYLVTGFLVGAFITLFLFSTQRRTLLYLT